MKKALKYLLIGFIGFVIINSIYLYLSWSIASKKTNDELNDTTPVMIDERELVKTALTYMIDYLNREETKRRIIEDLDVQRMCMFLNFNNKNVLGAKIDDISDIKKMEYEVIHRDRSVVFYLNEERTTEEHYVVKLKLTLKPECVFGNGYSFTATQFYNDGMAVYGNVITMVDTDEIIIDKTVYLSKDGNVVDYSDLTTVELSEYGKQKLAEEQKREAVSKDIISKVLNNK